MDITEKTELMLDRTREAHHVGKIKESWCKENPLVNVHYLTDSGCISRTHPFSLHLPFSRVCNGKVNRSFAELFVYLVNRPV